VVFLAACRQDMHDQPKYRAYSYSSFWNDSRSMRPRVDNTIARGQLKIDSAMHRGRAGDQFVNEIPYKLTRDFVARGQQRYDIYCAPCHGGTGDGEGMVVQRGFKHPPTYHQDRLRNQPVGYIYDVITNGYGSMISYASRIPVQDRWAIVAYVKALQLSQNANVSEVPEADRSKLDAPVAAAKPAQEVKH
jgi:cytochrome c